MADALRQLRTYVTTLLTVALVWFVTAQPTADALVRRGHAKQILAWLAVRDALSEAYEPLSEPTGEVVRCLTRLVPLQSGTEVEECRPISVVLPLLEHATGILWLVPVPELPGVYRVWSSVTAAPLASYSVAAVEDGIWVLPGELALRTPRDVANAALRDGLAAPRDWAAVKAELYGVGWTGAEPADLKFNDPVVSKFVAGALDVTFSVANVPVSAPLYPAVAAGFIGLLGFLMLGPLLKLRQLGGTFEGESWIMIARAPGRLGGVLSAVQGLVAVAFGLLPVVVFLTQSGLWSLLEPSERAIWVIPSILLFAVPLVVACAAHTLWRLRGPAQDARGAAPAGSGAAPPSA